jgi:uncharacterized membrane protein (UPF0136 family)
VKPKALDRIVLSYGIFLIVMGVIGYVVGHHLMSLIAGGLAGALVLFFLAITAKKRQIGRIGVAVISLLMFLQFAGSIAMRLTADPATAPKTPIWQAYVIAPVSLLVFAALGMGHMAAMKERRLE